VDIREFSHPTLAQACVVPDQQERFFKSSRHEMNNRNASGDGRDHTSVAELP